MQFIDRLYPDFIDALEREDKAACVRLALAALETGQTDIPGLYTQILAPALNNATANDPDSETAIWKEHVRSGIVRTILECCYPYLQRALEREGSRSGNGTVVIVSPAEEYHEIGARMGADFFSLCGYETVFVGSNTPRETLIAGIRQVKPVFAVIHATNMFSLVQVKKIITELRLIDPSLRILGAGRAFRQDPGLRSVLDVMLVDSVADIQALSGPVPPTDRLSPDGPDAPAGPDTGEVQA